MNIEQKKELLKKYGYNTVSYQSLMDGMKQFSIESIQGYISYIQLKKTFIAIGDPICSNEDMFDLVHAFRLFSTSKRGYCSFISVSFLFQRKLEIMGFGTLKIGEEAIFEMKNFSLEGKEKRDIRNMLSRAKKEGVTIRRLETMDEKILEEIEQLNTNWLKGKKVKGFSFLLKLTAFENFSDKIIFIAEKDEELMGYLTAVPIYGRKGYYFEDIIRSDNAPLGTNQFLVYSCLEYLKESGYDIASLGTSPLGNIQVHQQNTYKKTQSILKFIYENVNGFYNFKGLYLFKKNLCPTTWESKYIGFYPAKLKPKLFLSIAKAYNPGGITGIVVSKIKKNIEKIQKKSV